jgi:chemotaxis response regulator CheB
VLPRVYICDDNPRMRQLIEERLDGHAEIVGTGGTAQAAVAASGELEPDVVVLDFRTAVGNLDESVAAIKASAPSAVVVVHTGVPRYLVQAQVEAAGGVYSPKSEPEHLVGVMRTLSRVRAEAASRGS